MTPKPLLVKVLQVALWITPVVFFGYLTLRYTAIDGTYTYIWTPGEQADKNIQPLGRASKPVQDLETGEVFQRITSDPVYVSIQVPRTFDQVTATVDLHNSGQPLVELGLQNSTAWQFELHPLDVPVIEELDWFALEDEQGNVLLQKEKQFASISDFLEHLPLEQRIITYYQNLDPEFVMQTYVKQPNVRITSPLRGSHTFFGYVQAQPVSVDVTFLDVNRSFDVDALTISLLQYDQVITQAVTEDDGNVIADGQVSSSRTLHLESPGQVNGEFTLQLSSTDDIIITQIETNVGYLVTKQVYLAGNTEYRPSSSSFNTASTNLTSNANLVQAVTSHPANLQTIAVGDDELELLKANVTEQLLREAELSTLHVPLNDVQLSTIGWMSFTPESFFDPDYLIDRLTPNTNLDQAAFVFAADLPQHSVTDNMRSVSFDVTPLPGDKKNLNFILSAPGLDQRKAELTISSIRFEFTRPPLTLSGIFQRLKHRLFS